MSTDIDKSRLAEVTDHVTEHQPAITHFGKHLPDTSLAGISYVNMLSQARIADALERIADALEGQSAKENAEAAVG